MYPETWKGSTGMLAEFGRDDSHLTTTRHAAVRLKIILSGGSSTDQTSSGAARALFCPGAVSYPTCFLSAFGDRGLRHAHVGGQPAAI
jgi:hypothetical protein